MRGLQLRQVCSLGPGFRARTILDAEAVLRSWFMVSEFLLPASCGDDGVAAAAQDAADLSQRLDLVLHKPRFRCCGAAVVLARKLKSAQMLVVSNLVTHIFNSQSFRAAGRWL